VANRRTKWRTLMVDLYLILKHRRSPHIDYVLSDKDENGYVIRGRHSQIR